MRNLRGIMQKLLRASDVAETREDSARMSHHCMVEKPMLSFC